MELILIVLLVVLLLGVLPAWPYSAGWGYTPSAVLVFLLIVILISLAYHGRLGF